MSSNDWIHNVASVRIYPPIGIARVGNSKDGWFYGPEIPGRFDMPDGGFKDALGAVKRQAARFRVYAFDKEGQVLHEVDASSGFDLNWSVQVANKKASWYTFMGRTQEGAFQLGYTTLRNPLVQPDLHPDKRDKLIVDSGIQRTSGKNAPPVELSGNFFGSKTQATPVYLGEARTDEAGRLVVLAGRGYSRSIVDPDKPYPLILTDFDSSDWIDDTCDGWVDVEVFHPAIGTRGLKPQSKARVIGTTPKFANGIYAPTTLFDVMEDIYEQVKRTKSGYDIGEVEWYRDVWPLLQRPALLSWVNGQADGGHGPNGPGNFFDPKWQAALSIKSEDNDAIRKGILGRMRLPENNEKYKQARAGQAYPYFMPWLSGDGGRTTAGDQSTFTSITELQYDRLVKWSNGKFTKDEKSNHLTPACFNDIPLRDQPAALTRAALDATIGAPLFPGIEMSWNAELAETYDLNQPFNGGLNLAINQTVKSGDLTKFLSLPWQSDFYMCRSYWWPSARPDAIVREKDYERVAKSVKPSDIAKQLTTRVPWERGLHQNYTDEYGDQPLFANTDMAQNWHQLGFIVERPTSGSVPIFVETQRGSVHHKVDILKDEDPPTRIRHGGGIELPRPDHKNEPISTLESLKTHLQKALAIELATIPLYLYGMYSIKTPEQFVNDPRYYDPIAGAIRGVVAEEMLHLSLVGNILLAVAGKPTLYDPDYIPSYSMVMPGRVPELTLQLRKLTKENLETFIQVEQPDPSLQPQADEYHSLGDFYTAIAEGLEHLTKKYGNIFHPDTAPYQFSPGLGYQPQIRDAGGSIVVTDLKSAQKAINTIVVQGEGEVSGRPFDDKDKLEKDHYDVFLDLQKGSDSWDVYPVRSNPKTYQYYDEDRRIYHVSLAFDAAYCYLLLTIEKLWTIPNDDSRHKLVLANMFGIMMGVMAPLAKFLVQQPIGKKGENAGPCFCYYQFTKGKSALKQVQEEMQNAIDAYVDVTAETPDQVAVYDYGGKLETLLPIQVTVNGLLDLDTFTRLERPGLLKTKQPGVHNTGAKGFARGF
ncbi:hypothetical protein M422DRAFT_32162 [Sphaerobolus stellatus SS14]|uniref:Iminophenyl-pyruvate dimer synthase domain-containing protein n=1 Tax=Sphaerobolus stellatus (strain SS14) TaxID=990650 RepID=A0A0C9VH43_SPHS4|nr:hypothetical protein M422DRAFT_32162 [Sphaerobolus stellatus SS14]